MSVDIVSDSEIIQEANQILLKNMSPSKVARFWAIWQKGDGDYQTWRDATFGSETIDSLYDEIKAFQERASEK